MKAIQGDMISHFLSGKKVGVEMPDDVFAGFDMVAMCSMFLPTKVSPKTQNTSSL